ncbi:MAG: RNA polymerase factor sigma-54 [Parvibaculales bacterium]
MKLQTNLKTKQSQNLMMTPQMQQAIALLQFNNIELDKKITEEVEKNPLLERASADGVGAEIGRDGISPASGDENLDAAAGQNSGAQTDMGEQMQRGEMLGTGSDADYENRWDAEETGFVEAGQIDPGSLIEQIISEKPSLREHLRRQIEEEVINNTLKPVCLALVEWLDDEGYLRENDAEICKALGVKVDVFREALSLCQQLQPVGIFARSLTDCLSLQLRANQNWAPAYETLLANLDLIMRGELTKLMRLCDVRPQQLDKMIHDLRALDPHPARAFASDVLQARAPEVIVYEDAGEDTGYRIELNEETLPKIVVLNGYWEELAAKKMSKQDRKYLQDSYQNGQWLVRALTQRAASILQVAREIFRQQSAFLSDGIRGLKPMVMRDVADALDMHESTVSRVVANKLVQTPRGVFEMRYFFTNSIASTDGGTALSAEAVRERIRHLIETELEMGRKKILSDEAISKILKSEGMDIARRTVAKYREAMHIPTSAERKRAARAASVG